MSRTHDAISSLLTPRPTPHAVEGVDVVQTSLSAGWTYCAHPLPGFQTPEADTTGWAPITVPGEPAMQGFPVEFDEEAGYRLLLPPAILPDGCRALLRFDGVYNQARVWINGDFVGSHLGGFTQFEFDVTDLLQRDAENLLVVGVTDRSDSVSTASNYAFHCIGGILRPVSLLIVPETGIEDLRISTPVDDTGSAFVDFDLRIGGDPQSAVIDCALFDPDGKAIDLEGHTRGATAGPDGGLQRLIPVPDALLWSDETPFLYELHITVRGLRSVEYRQRIGLRRVEIVENRFLVNGRSTVLRGVNRHDIDPRLGRSTDGTLERRDLELFKAANINFVRTSHYPPHPALLEAADELGVYVEVENGVCWAGQFGWPATQDDASFLHEYIGPLGEMIAVSRNHPSVIIWSIGNESTWGENFARSHELVSALDDSRPIIMSFHGGPEDILSSHYPPYGSDLGSHTKPVLHDEVVHVPVYQSGELRRDPGFHSDWATTIQDFVASLYAAEGGMGLAIWSGVDEQFHLPGGTVGFGPWGLIDIWRRRKPEWWAVRTAYSPVRWELEGERDGLARAASLEVHNAYATRNLAELTLIWHFADGSDSSTAGPDVAPGERSRVTVPDEAVRLVTVDGNLVVDDRLLVAPTPEKVETSSAPVRLIESDGVLLITGENDAFRIEFDRGTGLISRATNGGSPVTLSGPTPAIAGIDLPVWRAQRIDVSETDPYLEVRVVGAAGPLHGEFGFAIDGSGTIRASYDLKLPAGEVSGRILEAGVELRLDSSSVVTEWISGAPGAIAGDGHLRRPRGRATRDAQRDPRQYGDESASWNEVQTGAIDRSVRDLWSRDFRAGRPDILRQTVTDVSGTGIAVILDGGHGTRLSPASTHVTPDDTRVNLIGAWQYREVAGGLNQGSSGAQDHRCDEPGARAILRFSGAAVDCVGALGPDLGVLDVILDGVPAGQVDLFSPVDCSGHTIFSAQDLPFGEHELELVLTGRRHQWSTGCGARLQGFEVYEQHPEIILGLLRKRLYPVSGSFDWIDPAIIENTRDGLRLSGEFTMQLLAPVSGTE